VVGASRCTFSPGKRPARAKKTVNAKRHLFWIVVSLIGVASMACGKDQGAGEVEAGAPSSRVEAGGSSSGAEAGMSSGGPTCGSDGAEDVAMLEAFPSALDAGGDDGGMPEPIAGTATFVTTAVSVDLKISITGCVNGNAYPVVIHQGPGCTSAIVQGPAWDAPRGEAIPYLTCTGSSGVGLLYYARADSDSERWSVGAPSSTDVTGHVVVIHDPKTMQPLACGLIGPAQSDGGDASPAAAPAPVPSVSILAQLAGACFFRQMSPTGQCPDTEKFAECACTHCGLSECLSQCSGTVACLESNPDAGCASACPAEPACAACASSNLRCLLGFCPDQVNCAVPTPGGPCSQLEACCARQNGGRANPCLAAVKEIEQLGGDPSCVGTMHDYDFLTNAAYDPPCDFDDAGVADAAGDR
jgi:hypothetical protein